MLKNPFLATARKSNFNNFFQLKQNHFYEKLTYFSNGKKEKNDKFYSESYSNISESYPKHHQKAI